MLIGLCITRGPGVLVDADGAPIEGPGGEALRCVEQGGLVVVGYDAEGPPASGDASARANLECVEDLRVYQDLLPMQLGQALEADAEAMKLLTVGGPRFERLLTLVAGCDEWEARAAEGGGDAEPARVERSGAGYLRSLRRRAQEAKGADAAQAAAAERVATALAPLARRHLVVTTSGRTRVVLLVEREREAALRDAAAGAGAVLVGPFAPYSFVGLEGA